MIPTFVFGYPTGQETGAYLAVDLGSLHFIILLLNYLLTGAINRRRNQFESLSC